MILPQVVLQNFRFNADSHAKLRQFYGMESITGGPLFSKDLFEESFLLCVRWALEILWPEFPNYFEVVLVSGVVV